MFEVKLDGVDALVKKFEAVLREMHSLQSTMPREFADWRSEDMNSRYPDPKVTRRGRTLRIAKRIWNRGRGKAPKHPRPKHRRRRGHSRRPVLRPELLQQLKQRMIDLVKETVQWP